MPKQFNICTFFLKLLVLKNENVKKTRNYTNIKLNISFLKKALKYIEIYGHIFPLITCMERNSEGIFVNL